MLSYVVDVFEGRDMETTNIPGVLINMEMEGTDQFWLKIFHGGYDH